MLKCCVASQSKTALLASLVAALGMVCYYSYFLLPINRNPHNSAGVSIPNFYGDDLYPYLVGTRNLFLHHQSPYGPETTAEIQRAVYGRPIDPRLAIKPRDQHRFSYPLYVAFLMWPTIPFAVPVVLKIFFFLWVLLAIANVLLWARFTQIKLAPALLWPMTLLALTSYPMLEAIHAEQFTMLVSALLAGTAVAVLRGRLWVAGALLAISTIKPHLALLPTCFLLLWAASAWSRRQYLIWSFSAVMLLAWLSAQLVLPGWFDEWHQTLIAYRHYTPPPLSQYVLGSAVGKTLSAGLLLAIALLCWRWRQAPPQFIGFQATFALVLAAAVLALSMGDAVYDHILLLPTVLLIAKFWRTIAFRSVRLRVLLILGALALGWQWISACGVILAGLLSSERAHSGFLVMLPLRMAAPLPFILVALLGILMGTIIGQARKSKDSALGVGG